MIETKVIAATAGSGFGAAISSFLLWELGVNFWGASNIADAAGTAIAAVPAPVSVVVALLVSAGCTVLAGWVAPHTHRTDLSWKPPAATLTATPPAIPEVSSAPLPTPVVDITPAVPPA